MSIRIILVSHLGLARGMKEAVEFIVGKQTDFLTVEMDEEGAEKFSETFKELIAEEEKDTILVSDIPSGSPGTIAYSLLSQQAATTYLLSGMNLALVIELLLYRDLKEVEKLIEESLISGRETIQNYTLGLEEEEESDF